MLAVTLLAAWIVALVAVCWLAPGRVLAEPGSTRGSSVRDRMPAWGIPAPGSASTYRGLTAAQWAARYRHRTKQLQAARRVLFSSPSVTEAIDLAATIYGHRDELWRKARCETGGTYSPRSLNSSSGAAGLFQFLPSTFRSTPFRHLSIWSPYANALAAGWMHAAGRGGEWACR